MGRAEKEDEHRTGVDEKEKLRREMRRVRRGMEPAWIVAASARIQKSLIALPQFGNARSVASFLALPYEVQSKQVIERCWELGKRVCVPAFNEDKGRYELTWLNPEDETKPGLWNICEPLSTQRAGLTEVDFIMVPALAYDRMGGRLGHGGGHYDRILGSWSGFRAGVAFEFQLFDRVPAGSQDLPVDLVITEKTIYPPKP